MTFASVTSQLDFHTNFESHLWSEIALSICRASGIKFELLRRAPSSDHVVFLVDETFVLKIFRPERNCFDRELKALSFARNILRAIATPDIVARGDFEGFRYLITTQLPGRPLTRREFLAMDRRVQNAIVEQLAVRLADLHSLDPEPFTDDWPAFVEDRAQSFIHRQIEHGVNDSIIKALPAFFAANLPLVPIRPTRFLHGDVHFGNLRFMRQNGIWKVSGLFDFADSRRGWHEYEFLAVGVLMLQGERDLQRRFFRAYGYSAAELNEEMRRRMMMLTMLYETSDLRRYALRLRPEAVDYSLDELERAIWSFV